MRYCTKQGFGAVSQLEIILTFKTKLREQNSGTSFQHLQYFNHWTVIKKWSTVHYKDLSASFLLSSWGQVVPMSSYHWVTLSNIYFISVNEKASNITHYYFFNSFPDSSLTGVVKFNTDPCWPTQAVTGCSADCTGWLNSTQLVKTPYVHSCGTCFPVYGLQMRNYE